MKPFKMEIFLFSRLTRSHTMTPFDRSGKETFGNTLREKKNLLVHVISPFPTMFSVRDRNYHFCTFNLSSANAFNLVWSKILSCGNGVKLWLPVRLPAFSLFPTVV